MNTMPTESISVEVSGVSKRYTHRVKGEIYAARNVVLSVDPGEFLTLLGPSGCGKTTTLRMIAGFMPPTSGTIELDGQVISSPAGVVPPENRRMSMIFQSYAIWPNMTVGQNVGFGLEVRKVSRTEYDRRVNAILDIVQLRGLKDRYPAELSGGQQQRVAIARAIVSDPALLVCDEPTGDLDRQSAAEVLTLLQQLNRDHGKTIIMVTHDPKAADFARRILHLDKGTLVDIAERPAA